MTKQTVKSVAIVAPVAQAAAPVVKYVLGKTPRNGLNANTKHGSGGTAGTYAAIVKLLASTQDGATMAEIQALCKAQGDSGFARYAVRNHWLQAASPDKK